MGDYLSPEQIGELAEAPSSHQHRTPNTEHRDELELELLAAEWAKAGAALFRGPAVPTRAEVIFAAKRVVLLALVRKGMTITQAARRCNTSRRAIRDSMKHVGVYQAPPKLPTRDWDAETDLGKVPDRVLAERHDCSPGTVAKARRARGIAAYRRGSAGKELGQ